MIRKEGSFAFTRSALGRRTDDKAWLSGELAAIIDRVLENTFVVSSQL